MDYLQKKYRRLTVILCHFASQGNVLDVRICLDVCIDGKTKILYFACSEQDMSAQVTLHTSPRAPGFLCIAGLERFSQRPGHRNRLLFSPEAGFRQLWELNSPATNRWDTSETPGMNPLSSTIIWEYDLYFLK